MQALNVQALLIDLEKKHNLTFNVKSEIEKIYFSWKDTTITMLKEYDDEYCFYDDFASGKCVDVNLIVEYINKTINPPFKTLVEEFVYNLLQKSNLEQAQILQIAQERNAKVLYSILNNLCNNRAKKRRTQKE